LDLQKDALLEFGCEKVFTDKFSSVKQQRPGLEAILNYLRSGDSLVVWRLDRLGRSLKQLISTIDMLKSRGIEFISLTEAIDTKTAAGKLLFNVLASLAEFERDLIIERTHAGLAAARARGRKGGRPIKHHKNKVEAAIQLAASNSDQSIVSICENLGISRATYYRRLQQVNH
jgi:DNA invertase Pin-like site-specific DNA recombinase